MADDDKDTKGTEGGDKIEDPAKAVELARKKGAENASLKAKIKEQDEELERLRKLEEDQKSETEKLIDKARKEGAADAKKEMEGVLLKERIRARAAGKVADPDDAVSLIDASSLNSDDLDGIDKAVAALIESKPYLASDATPPKPKPKDIDQGKRDGGDVGKDDDGGGNDWLRQAIGRKTGVAVDVD